MQQVPTSQLKPGIAKCLEVAGWRLREAVTVLNSDVAPVTAAVLVTFAVEEFGKAVLLHEATATPKKAVQIAGFFDHDTKLSAAAKHIAAEHLLLHGGTFQDDFVQKDAFDTGNSVDLEGRLSALYVHWTNGAWQVGVRVDADLLRQNIAAIDAIVEAKRAEWT